MSGTHSEAPTIEPSTRIQSPKGMQTDCDGGLAVSVSSRYKLERGQDKVSTGCALYVFQLLPCPGYPGPEPPEVKCSVFLFQSKACHVVNLTSK